MKHFRKIWDEKKNEWIRMHTGIPSRVLYKMFLDFFPEASDVTRYAFGNQRSRLGCSAPPTYRNHYARHVPVGSTHRKKGYLRIKVAEPNVWKFMHHYVWEQNHPGETINSKSETILFLDLDNNNFNPENLCKIPRRNISRINSGKFGHLMKGDPEGNMLIIKAVELEQATMDFAESQGLTQNYGGGRFIVSSHNEKQRRYHTAKRKKDK